MVNYTSKLALDCLIGIPNLKPCRKTERTMILSENFLLCSVIDEVAGTSTTSKNKGTCQVIATYHGDILWIYLVSKCLDPGSCREINRPQFDYLSSRQYKSLQALVVQQWIQFKFVAKPCTWGGKEWIQILEMSALCLTIINNHHPFV